MQLTLEKKIKKSSLAIAFADDEDMFAISSDSSAAVYAAGKRLRTFRVAFISQMLFIRKNRCLWMVNTSGKIFIGNIQTGEIEKIGALPIPDWMDGSIFPYGDTSLVTQARGGIWMYDFEQNSALKMKDLSMDYPIILRVQPQGDVWYAILADSVNTHCPVKVFSLGRGTAAELPGRNYDLLDMYIAADDGNVILSCRERIGDEAADSPEATSVLDAMMELLTDSPEEDAELAEGDPMFAEMMKAVKEALPKMLGRGKRSRKSTKKRRAAVYTKSFYRFSPEGELLNHFSVPYVFSLRSKDLSMADAVTVCSSFAAFYGTLLEGVILTDFNGNELCRLNRKEDYFLESDGIIAPISFVRFRGDRMYVGTWGALLIYKIEE